MSTEKFNNLPAEKQQEIAIRDTAELPFEEAVGSANPNVQLDGQPVQQSAPPTVQPLVEDGPIQLSEHPDRIRNRRAWECHQRVEVGKLFHGWVKSWELKEATNGSVYIRFACQLECNQWRMSFTQFLPKSSLESTNLIAEARDEILADLDYDPESETNSNKLAFPKVKLFEIGSYKGKDGKDHLKIGRVYRDTHEYNTYQQWKWEQDRKPKKQWRIEHAPLPERK